MTARFTAPSRSPLRRTGYKNVQGSSPLRPQSQLSFSPSISCEHPVLRDLDAERLRAQAEVADESHDVAHLTPVLQRFWNVSSNQYHQTHIATASMYKAIAA